MLEDEAKNIIKTQIGNTLDSYEIKVIKRNFDSDFRYTAVFAVIAKEIKVETINAISQYIKDGNNDISFSSTQIDLSREFESELLLLTAKIDTDIN